MEGSLGVWAESWTMSNFWSMMSARGKGPRSGSPRSVDSWMRSSQWNQLKTQKAELKPSKEDRPIQKTTDDPHTWAEGSLWRRAFDAREPGWQTQDPSMKNKGGGGNGKFSSEWSASIKSSTPWRGYSPNSHVGSSLGATRSKRFTTCSCGQISNCANPTWPGLCPVLPKTSTNPHQPDTLENLSLVSLFAAVNQWQSKTEQIPATSANWVERL